MSNRTPFVLSSVVATSLLGVGAFLSCYCQEAARCTSNRELKQREAAGADEQLAGAAVVAPLTSEAR